LFHSFLLAQCSESQPVVSTVGLDEQMVREYIRDQDERDKYFDQAELCFSDSNYPPFKPLALLVVS
jgi:hypothetical protein